MTNGEHAGSPQNVEVLASGKNFDQTWSGMTEDQRSWVRHKAQWERMSLMAVMMEWGVPSDQRAKELLGEGERC